VDDTELIDLALANPQIAGFVVEQQKKPSVWQRIGLRQQDEDPRRVSTGTSYSTSGTVKPSTPVGVELGSSRGGLIRDVVPSLGNRAQAATIYEEMVNSDAAVDVSLRAAKMPVMGADYFIEPFDDSPEGLDIAEFVQFNLLQGSNSPFLNVLEDILRMYEHGFSIVEKVYEEREWSPKRSGANRRKYTMLRKLSARPALTVVDFEYDDNGGPVDIVQNAVRADDRPEEVTIDIEKLIIFTHNRKGGNLEGKSLLRTAYRPWYFKSNLYNIDGIQKERHGMGFPVVELPPGYKDSDKSAALELVRNIRTNEHGGAVLPPKWILRFLELPGQPVDVMRSIEHHNGTIMLNTMTQFLLLGLEGTGGGRATSGSHQDMFNKSLRYVANQICDAINLYCVPYLVGYNFKSDKFPKLRARNLGETKDLQQWASAMANLKAQKLINYTPETEVWVRAIVDAPLAPGVPPPEPGEIAQRGNVTDQNDGFAGAPTDDAEA
jgi:phage gp29-like protein